MYYLLKRLINSLTVFVQELSKPVSFIKGDDFEKCLRKKIFTKARYELVMKTHDFHVNSEDYVESSLYPDFLFRDKKSNKEFFVEAKYRENLFQGKVEWCKNINLEDIGSCEMKSLQKSLLLLLSDLVGDLRTLNKFSWFQ